MDNTAKIYKPSYLVTVILFGIVITVIKYYGFGVADHVEQLPLIYRAIDSEYLTNDFFVNSARTSLTRFWYSEMLAALAVTKENLPLVFFSLTMAVNVAISTITYLFTCRLYNKSPLSGLYASAATMIAITFTLGWNAEIFYNGLVPAAIATPLLMGAVWATLCKKIVTGTLLCIIAAVFQPLMGLELGFILLFTFILTSFYEKRPVGDFWKKAVLGFLILAITTITILYYEQDGLRLSTEKFIYILAYLRHPHHYLPGRFGFENYYFAVAFLLPAIFIFLIRKVRNSSYDNGIAAMGMSIILLCIGGYVFVEVFPSRLWTTAQTFRLLYFIKWLGLVVIAGNIPTYNFRSWKQLGLLFATANAIVMLCSHLFVMITSKIQPNSKAGVVTDILMLAVVIVMMRQTDPHLQLLPWVIILLLISLAAGYYRRFFIVSAMPMLIIGSILFFTNEKIHTYVTAKKDAYTEKVSNYFCLDNTSYFASSEIIMYIRKKTERNAVFLTPPMWGGFRIFAERAIVVDFKAFPFQDKAMNEWYDRLINCYGEASEDGFNIIGAYNENYRIINDGKLFDLKHLYNFSYAVLYNSTPTNFEVLSSDSRFKVVRIPE
jgi:hypothetical protein